MTREEAIRKLQKQKANYLEEWVDYSGVAEAYNMAIEALEQEPVKHGKWIEGDMLECNKCHHRMIVGGGAYNYCPNCGAR